MREELLAHLRAAFGWQGDVAVSPGPRGALGRIWRLDVGAASYALKEGFAEPPAQEQVAAELELSRRAVAAGVRVPGSRADREGRYLLTAPDGTWLRCYDWWELRPVDLAAAGTPAQLGALLARLHRSAPSVTAECTGGPPAAWYHRAPSPGAWGECSTSGRPWAAALTERLASMPALVAVVEPVDPADLVLCHRDLHPQNVLADDTGRLTVVDWDDVGPASPSREIATALFDWYADAETASLEAMGSMYDAYVQEGGPGRVRRPADFSMLVATRLNFLRSQLRIAADATAERGHRDWAEREIEEALSILPSPRQLDDVLALTRRRDCAR